MATLLVIAVEQCRGCVLDIPMRLCVKATASCSTSHRQCFQAAVDGDGDSYGDTWLALLHCCVVQMLQRGGRSHGDPGIAPGQYLAPQLPVDWLERGVQGFGKAVLPMAGSRHGDAARARRQRRDRALLAARDWIGSQVR